MIRTSFFIFFLFFLSSRVFAEISNETVIWNIQACIDARNGHKVASITEFYCPEGEYSAYDKSRYTDERIAYEVAVSLLFQDIDKDTEKSLKTFQESRETDTATWVTSKSTFLYGADVAGDGWVRNKYLTVCSEKPGESGIYSGRVRRIVHDWLNGQSSNLESFPDTYCAEIAKKKTQAWNNMVEIIAHQSTSKWFQNSQDRYMEKVKNVYDGLLDKWNEYKRIFTQAVTKLSAYIKTAVK